jgi:predicted nucleic acid-binding protein
MIHSPKFTAILDACVLYPAPVRDLLLQLGSSYLYKPMWTEVIQEEWVRNLLLKRPDLTREQLQKTVALMNQCFPDSNVENFEELIPSFTLPDPDDRHLLAAAVRCRADVVITYNLRDLPADYLGRYDVEPQHPDQFISNLVDLNPEEAVNAFRRQIANLRNPPKSPQHVIEMLRRLELRKTCDKLVSLLK